MLLLSKGDNLKKLKKFYVFGEHDEYTKLCRKMKMYPIKDNKRGKEFFRCNDKVYEVLFCNECYSGFTVTLMQLPEMNVLELLSLLSYTKYYSEFVGSIGILRVKHSEVFERALKEENFFSEKRKRKILKELMKISKGIY